MAATVLQGEGFRIQFEPCDTYLRGYVYDGVDSLQVSIAMWTMLAEQSRLHHSRRLLVVEDLQSTVELTDINAVVDAIVALGFGDTRIAFVELQDDVQGSEHGEILARERDVTIMVFSNESRAMQWLLYGAD